uniref:G-protein coupled receptors family 1 profile domain-containing protein n=1 Tax=Panagrolaimus sp. JU765 TaxID=591449 RepID=A0AC34RTA4_9BILA
MKTRFAHRTNEKKLVQNFIIVIQFIIICLFQWFSAFFFFMVPYSFGTTLNGVLVTNLCGMLNPSINAIVMFASNKRIKQMLAELFRKRTLLVFITKNSDKTILVKSRIHPSYPEQFSPSAKRGSNMTQVFFKVNK